MTASGLGNKPFGVPEKGNVASWMFCCCFFCFCLSGILPFLLPCLSRTSKSILLTPYVFSSFLIGGCPFGESAHHFSQPRFLNRGWWGNHSPFVEGPKTTPTASRTSRSHRRPIILELRLARTNSARDFRGPGTWCGRWPPPAADSRRPRPPRSPRCAAQRPRGGRRGGGEVGGWAVGWGGGLPTHYSPHFRVKGCVSASPEGDESKMGFRLVG